MTLIYCNLSQTFIFYFYGWVTWRGERMTECKHWSTIFIEENRCVMEHVVERRSMCHVTFVAEEEFFGNYIPALILFNSKDSQKEFNCQCYTLLLILSCGISFKICCNT